MSRSDEMGGATHHPDLHLLAVERTGWRRWIFGRWVYSSEPFRRDIQKQCAECNLQMLLRTWERVTPKRTKRMEADK